MSATNETHSQEQASSAAPPSSRPGAGLFKPGRFPEPSCPIVAKWLGLVGGGFGLLWPPWSMRLRLRAALASGGASTVYGAMLCNLLSHERSAPWANTGAATAAAASLPLLHKTGVFPSADIPVPLRLALRKLPRYAAVGTVLGCAIDTWVARYDPETDD